MARLSPLDDAKPWNPPSEALIGRSTMCTLQIDAADVSKEHASLRWVGDGWELRDLGSRNGTFVGPAAGDG
jgi:pSer/pThr/pTyr-binding forkhead associated (FHA) protein